jgi:hypothetical protein
MVRSHTAVAHVLWRASAKSTRQFWHMEQAHRRYRSTVAHRSEQASPMSSQSAPICRFASVCQFDRSAASWCSRCAARLRAPRASHSQQADACQQRCKAPGLRRMQCCHQQNMCRTVRKSQDGAHTQRCTRSQRQERNRSRLAGRRCAAIASRLCRLASAVCSAVRCTDACCSLFQ